MKAIKTKYHGPGNVKGSRISATDEDGNRIILSYDHALNAEENHKAAALALISKMKWDRSKGYKGIIGGSLKACYVWVFIG
jgi:hypothetical protein